MNIVVCHSRHERCGVREYGRALDQSLMMFGAYLVERTFADIEHGIQAAERKSILLVHYEPSLVSAHRLIPQLRVARDRGMRVVFCCHYYLYATLAEYNGLVDCFVLHRNYESKHVESAIIPLGCPVYDLIDSRESLRRKLEYPAGSVVMTTIGFLTRWKQIPEITAAIMNAMLGHPSLFLHVHTPKPYYEDEASQLEEPRIRSLLAGHPAGSRVRHTLDFLPDAATLDLAYSADVGFLYHPINTGSVSAATKQFVSTRRALVVTGSTHASDLRGGAWRVEGFDAWTFANAVVETALDEKRRAELEADMRVEYDRINMHAVAREYMNVFRALVG